MNYKSLNELAIENIRAIIGARRESIETLSTGSGIKLSTIKRRLTYDSPLTLGELEMVAKYLNVSATQLISPLIPPQTFHRDQKHREVDSMRYEPIHHEVDSNCPRGE